MAVRYGTVRYVMDLWYVTFMDLWYVMDLRYGSSLVLEEGGMEACSE